MVYLKTLAFARWIQKWWKELQNLQKAKALEDERRHQQKKQEDQRVQALLHNLYDLQRTMDPLLAAQIYNSIYCPLISRLPEELLLHILDFLDDDAVTLHCLQIVSRTFLRLLNRQSAVWRDEWYDSLENYGKTLFLTMEYMGEFRRLLQRDGRCDNCRRWRDNQGHPSFDDCKFQQHYRGYRPYTLYRDACDSQHDVCQFPSGPQQMKTYRGERRCLGQQGSVQLCEHIQITWDSIKTHIDNWRQQHTMLDGWKNCLESFNIECHDATHDTRCTALEVPTWPRARLGIELSASPGSSTWSPENVVLILEWTPYSCIDALILTTDGRIPAPELRALIQRLRSLGPVDNMCPPWRPSTLHEMVFFGPLSSRGRFVYYKTGPDDEMGPPPESFPPLPSQSWLIWNRYFAHGQNRTELRIKPHYPEDAAGTDLSSQCLMIRYERYVMICKALAVVNPFIQLVPTDHWLHAMDTETYPHPQASGIRPQCRDEACNNYYRRRKDYHYCYTYHRSHCHYKPQRM